LLAAAHAELAAGVILISPDGIVAGVTVTVTTDVAAALSVKVSVTGVATWTLLGVKVSEAPVTDGGTGKTALSLDLTVNGPFPPEIPTVLGVFPNATNVLGLARSAVAETGVVDELEPPQPDKPIASVTASAPSAHLSEKY
jgi:hypothetical protein